MGYVWMLASNVLRNDIVHATMKDTKAYKRRPGVVFACNHAVWWRTKNLKRTKRKVTCIQCIGEGWDK